MAKFLKTTGISHHLENIINTAGEKLYLISPYLQVNTQLKLLLDDASQREMKTCIVYGKNRELQDLDWINSVPSFSLYFYESLHAKCYLNEREAVITSMNLYTYSQQNNCEMGILVTLKDDPELYGEITAEAERIIRQSELKKQARKRGQWGDVKGKASNVSHGYCIRTGVQIPFNVESPFSYRAFTTWSQFGDEYYPEKYCHFSGELSDGETCYARPILKKNWKEAQRKFGL